MRDYRLIATLISGKRVLDLSGASSLGTALLREAGNTVDLEPQPGQLYDAVIDVRSFGTREDVRRTLNRLGSQLAAGGVFIVAADLAPQTGANAQDPENLRFRFESLAKLLQSYFRVVTYAFAHGEEFRAEWDQYSDAAIFFGRHLTATALDESGSFLDRIDDVYGGSTRGLLPFSLAFVQSWMAGPGVGQQPVSAVADPGRNLLFFIQPLPLYNNPLVYQRFFERYWMLGEQYRELGWNPFYSTTTELKSLYGLPRTFAPEDFGYPPPMRDWRVVYAKTLDPACSLDDPDLKYWAGYINSVLDRVQPAAIFLWNKNVLVDRLAEERGIAVIHNELAFDRAPRPATYFFDPRGVNAECSLPQLWAAFQHARLPECCYELVRAYRQHFLAPWLGTLSRTEVLGALGLDPARPTAYVPLQVENDSNVLHNSPFPSMREFVDDVIGRLPPDWNVVVKPHPADPAPSKLTSPRRPGVRVVDRQHPAGPLLRACDRVFTLSSTTGYEALAAGKPVEVLGSAPYAGVAGTDPFLFLASFFYPLDEKTMSSARLQAPLLEKTIELKRERRPVTELWPDPSTVDWEKFCSGRLSLWFEHVSRSKTVVSFPRHDALAAVLPELEAEQQRLVRALADVNAAREIEREEIVLREQEAARKVAEASRETLQTQGRVHEFAKRMRDLESGLKVVEHAYRDVRDRSRKDSQYARQWTRWTALHARLLTAHARKLRTELDWERTRRIELESRPPAVAAPPPRLPLWKGLLHGALDVSQSLTPGFVRNAVRPFYLNQIYFRLYPESRPGKAISAPPPIEAGSNFQPYVELKTRLHAGLPYNISGVGCHEVPGLVSVVLPVYNGEAYIAEAIDSVLAQSYSNFELIVVNDGSTDGTPRILEGYASESRVRVIHQPNRKLPGALNRGFSECSGEFWTWTSADNLMVSDMLELLVEFLRRRPEIQAVWADEELIDDRGLPAVKSDFCPGYQTPFGSANIAWPQDPGQISFIQNNYVGGCFLYRGWAGRLVGLYSDHAFGYEDYDFWMRMNDLFRMAHLGSRRPLYSYRLHQASLSAREKELRIVERVRNYMPFEASRRGFFARPFDIAFYGEHPWFADMANAYRGGGHNVFHASVFNDEARYRGTVTRAFEKMIAVFGEQVEPEALAFARAARALIVQFADEPTIKPDLSFGAPRSQAGFEVSSWKSALYPLLAGANSILHWRDHDHPESQPQAVVAQA